MDWGEGQGGGEQEWNEGTKSALSFTFFPGTTVGERRKVCLNFRLGLDWRVDGAPDVGIPGAKFADQS